MRKYTGLNRPARRSANTLSAVRVCFAMSCCYS